MTLTGCLDENARDSLDESQVYTSAKAVYVNAVATLYNYMGSDKDSEGLQGTYRGVYDYNTFTTDEALIPVRGGDWYDGGFWENLYLHRWKTDDGPLYNTWLYFYKVITFSNDGLATIDKYRHLLTDTQYKAYRAEVRAVRAMFYYYLMDMFGNVPLITGVEETPGNAVQTGRPEVFRFVVKELQEVEPLLPAGHSNFEGKDYGRVTRSVADFLLAKLMLNAEVYADADWTDGQQPDGSQLYFAVDGQQMNAWQACKHYCDKVTAAGFTLAPEQLLCPQRELAGEHLCHSDGQAPI